MEERSLNLLWRPNSMLQSVLPVAVLVAIASLALFRPTPAKAPARRCAGRRPNR
jgi:hypothetical protein